MKELTFGTMIAVFEEIFGRGLFWAMVVVAALITVAYLFVLIRDRSVSWRKFLLAQLSMPVGAVLQSGSCRR
jgi:glucan phosphoethanolaminetransferase (alkaline phosphatase superfamily)